MKKVLHWIVRNVRPFRYIIHEHLGREHLGPCNCDKLLNKCPKMDYKKLIKNSLKI